MEWWVILSVGLTLLLGMFLTGLPIFISFLIINIIGVFILFGQSGFPILTNSMFDTANTASLATIPLFILLGELLFRSGTIDALLNTVDVLVGRIRGRQYFVSIALSTLFGALSGAAMGVAAMLGRSLFPSMIKRGYDVKLSIGTMLAGASLAPIIPPSILAIIIGTLADVSIAKLLMAGILPGLLLSGLFIIYALLRIHFNPSLAPPLDDESKTKPNWNDKIRAIAQSLPFVVIIFSIMGVIFLGIATPSEAAATGVLGALLTAAIYKKLSWKLTWEATGSAAAVGAMVLAIMASSKMFSQILAFTGATKSLTVAITSLPVSDTSMLLVMLLLPFILCMFIDQIALMLVIIPIYEPVIASLGFDPVWFWTLFLINITVGGITPPFGYTMFAFIGAAEGVTIKDVFAASWPFVGLFILGTAILIKYPSIITYLSSLL